MIALLALALVHPALATPKAERDAEATRLSAEIERLSQKTAWSGVERNYLKLVALKNTSVRSDVHLLAAHAALVRGDIRVAWERSQRATARATTPTEMEEAAVWIADFWVNYAEVEIELSVAFDQEAAIVSRDGGSFSPKTRIAAGHAAGILNAERVFRGFLPMGRYQVGDTRFELVGGPMVKVFIKPARGDSPAPPATPIPPEPEAAPHTLHVLSVRGGGWIASDWSALSASMSSALREVEGVVAVDDFGPEAPWIVIDLDASALEQHSFSVDHIATVLTVSRDLTELVIVGQSIAIPPGRVSIESLPPTALGAAANGDQVYLASVATIRAGNPGAIPVPADGSEKARYRIEITADAEAPGLRDRLLAIASAVEGAAVLGLRLEEPATR